MGPKQQGNTEEEYVSFTQVKVVNHQKDVFTAVLEQQQDVFKDLIKVIMDSTNFKLDSFTKEDLKLSKYTQKNVNELKITQAKQSDHCNTIQTVCRSSWTSRSTRRVSRGGTTL